jgi:dienelactone hydrolase
MPARWLYNFSHRVPTFIFARSIICRYKENTVADHYQHLGIYSDWVAAAHRQHPLFPIAAPGPATQELIRETLGFCHADESPAEVRVEREWKKDGLIGQEVSWSVGFGPRTYAYVFKPVNATRPLPGIVALHDHSDFKFYGREKIADGPDETLTVLTKFRQVPYGGRAYVNALAHEGYVVLVHDVFLWGSRGFPYETMMETMDEKTSAMIEAQPDEVERYNTAASFHEHRVSKYCNVLGTSMAGVVAYEDRIALNYLLSRADVDTKRIACIGLSGGGNRAALLSATHDRIKAAVIIGLMTTYPALLDHNMSHTWMLFPFGWARHGDWPDIAACRAPMPLLVQYDLQDYLFTEVGMKDAHARLQGHYDSVGNPAAYTGQFYPGTHKFDLEMQAAAFAWLSRQFD